MLGSPAAPLPTIDPRPDRRHSGAAWPIGLLLLLVVATRLPLLGNFEGEPDTGLFVEGLWRWLSYGPHVPEIYGKNLSPAYYWSVAHLCSWLRISPAHFPLVMNLFSLAAALASAPLLYAIGRKFLSPAASWASGALFLVGPSLWWLGFEPHPQGPAIAFFLAAVYCFLRADLAALPAHPAWKKWSAAMVACLTVSLLLRADHVLLFAAFPALLLAQHWDRVPSREGRDWRAWQAWLPSLLATAVLLAAASLLFILLRAGMLAESFAATQAYSKQQTGGYMYYGLLQLARSKAYILKQLLPLATATGVLATAGCLFGLLLGIRRWGHIWWSRWLLLWAGWSAAGYIFWFLILGNNIRHVTLLVLPLLWAGCQAWERLLSPRRLVLLAIAVMALDPFLIPASSNVTIYASANVPASARMLRQRQQDLRADLSQMLRGSAETASARIPACFLGSYTTPYLISFELMQQNRLDSPAATSHPVFMRVGPGFSDIFLSTAGAQHWMRFYEMYSEDEYAKLRPGCGAAFSAEYDSNGFHQRFLGEEWRTVPLQSVWYPRRSLKPPRLTRK